MKDSYTNLTYAYDFIGNMTHKSDIGHYTYSNAKPHQVVTADKGFTYDQNANMKNNNGTLIEYTAFNKVSKLTTPTDTIEFNYDTNKNRYKKKTSKETSYYIDKSYEKTIKQDNSVEDRYFIYVGSKVMSIYTDSTNNPSTKYLHYDSLNSVDTITNNLGVVESRMAYKPFGEKLNLDKDGKTTTKASHTNRGYTGHEHIEETNLINMNARLYDPTIARFISADSIIPYMYDTQSFNRYSYVRNNPLKYIDPSGHFSLSSIGSSISSALKDTGGGLSTTFKDVGGSIAYNKYNIYGVVLIVVGIIVIAETWGGSELAGGIGGGLITAGIGMLNYKPDEEESQQNQIYIGTGGSSGVPDFTVVEWGGSSQSQSEQEQYIVNNVSQGTHSVTTGNKLNNGADTNSFIVTIGDYSNVNGSGVGNNALGVDKAEIINSNSVNYINGIDIKEVKYGLYTGLNQVSLFSTVFAAASVSEGDYGGGVFWGSIGIATQIGIMALEYDVDIADMLRDGSLDYMFNPKKPIPALGVEAIKQLN